jgi:hypothetical protein
VQPDIGNNSGQHPLYSEIIELDFAYAPGPYGDFSAFGMEVWDLFTKEEQSFIDNLPNRKITISNNIVEPKISNTGEMVSYGQNFVGSHVSRADLPRDKFTSDLLIENNKIINPIPVENVSFTATGEKKKANFPWNGILHFTELDRAVIRNNTFEINAADIQKRASIISMFDGGTSVKNIDGVIIEGNKIASAKGHYEKFIEWGGSGKQVEELKSKIQSAN